MIPSDISSLSTGKQISMAESKVFAALEQLSIGRHGICFHSLNLPEHEYKMVCEVDFLIVCSRGILCLEVKGGGVKCEDGIWTTRNRFNEENRLAESPFDQASGAMFAFRDLLNNVMGYKLDIPYGYGVIFPDCYLEGQVPQQVNSFPGMWIDQSTLGDPSKDTDVARFKDSLENAYSYWGDKFCNQFPDKPRSVPLEVLTDIRDRVRPDFELVAKLGTRAANVDVQLSSLTESQYIAVDTIAANSRNLVSGGAGTGKTYLALETANRDIVKGKTVGLICKSQALASWLDSQIARNVQPSLLSEATVKSLALSFEVFEKSNYSDHFDVIIVDEAQDVMDFDCLETISSGLKGGLDSGRWVMFYDANNQAGIYNVWDQDAFDYLSATGASNVPLTRNCRNTRPIVDNVNMLTNADVGIASAGDGPTVTFLYYTSKSEQVEILKSQLESWRNEEEVAAGNITILSPKPWADSCAKTVDRLIDEEIVVLEGAFGSDYPPNHVTFCEIATFKGFENQTIILVDFDNLDSLGVAYSNLYVGMTRARAKLVVLMRSSTKSDMAEAAQVS